MKKQTLRQLIVQCVTIAQCIPSIQDACKEVDPSRPWEAYEGVCQELLRMPKARAYKYPILVRPYSSGTKEPSPMDVCLLNEKAQDWPKGKRPWGGKDAPAGYFNVNDKKYSRYWSLIGTTWEQLIDTPVINEAKASPSRLLASVLWELTFDGWTSKDCKAAHTSLKARLDASVAQFKKLSTTVGKIT